MSTKILKNNKFPIDKYVLRTYNGPVEYKGGDTMTPEDRTIIQALADAMKALGDIPKEKQEYILGYAECLAGISEMLRQQSQTSA